MPTDYYEWSLMTLVSLGTFYHTQALIVIPALMVSSGFMVYWMMKRDDDKRSWEGLLEEFDFSDSSIELSSDRKKVYVTAKYKGRLILIHFNIKKKKWVFDTWVIDREREDKKGGEEND